MSHDPSEIILRCSLSDSLNPYFLLIIMSFYTCAWQVQMFNWRVKDTWNRNCRRVASLLPVKSYLEIRKSQTWCLGKHTEHPSIVTAVLHGQTSHIFFIRCQNVVICYFTNHTIVCKSGSLWVILCGCIPGCYTTLICTKSDFLQLLEVIRFRYFFNRFIRKSVHRSALINSRCSAFAE